MKARGENVTKGALIALALSVATPAVSHAQPANQPELKRRNNIQVMEGVLARAGVVAAEHIAAQLQQLDPSMTAFIGDRSARARGFVLEGYGIFFDVEVPELRGAVVWSQMTQQRDLQIGNALSMLKRALQEMPEGPSRQQALSAIRLLDVHAGPVQQQVPIWHHLLTGPADERGFCKWRDTPAVVDGASLAALLWDPNGEYSDAVQRELIDAILNYGSPMDVGPDDWLWVARAGGRGRASGADADAARQGQRPGDYAADKARREEIRGKVEVRVY